MTYQREFKQRLNVALVGVGSHTYRNLLPALHFMPIHLVAICDVNEELARTTAEEYGVQKSTPAPKNYMPTKLWMPFLFVLARISTLR